MYYTIFINNRRGANTTYAVCIGPPQFRAPGIDLEGFMSVWRSYNIPDQGYMPFMLEADYYAWVGTAPQPPAPGFQVTNGMSLPTRLGTTTEPGSAFEMQVIQNFPVITEVPPSTVNAGAYEIWTGHDFLVPNDKYLIGVGKYNHRQQVVPVAFIKPKNNARIQISPKMKFWIVESDYEVGTIINYTADPNDGAIVDFTSGDGAGTYIAEVFQTTDGKFDVAYHWPQNE